MIIDFEVNYNNYEDKILNYFGFWQYICPFCNSHHSFTRHGTYYRNFCIVYLDVICDYKIKILRLVCNSCKTTHAILPADTIPYCIYSYSCILHILAEHYIYSRKILKISDKYRISYQLIYIFISRLSSQFKDGISFLRTFWASQLDFSSSLKDFISVIIRYKGFQRDFMISTKSVFLMMRNQFFLTRRPYIVAYSRPPT